MGSSLHDNYNMDAAILFFVNPDQHNMGEMSMKNDDGMVFGLSACFLCDVRICGGAGVVAWLVCGGAGVDAWLARGPWWMVQQNMNASRSFDKRYSLAEHQNAAKNKFLSTSDDALFVVIF
jgi:hypothetical protein